MYGLVAVGAGFPPQSSLCGLCAVTDCDRLWSYFMMKNKRKHSPVLIYQFIAGWNGSSYMVSWGLNIYCLCPSLIPPGGIHGHHLYWSLVLHLFFTVCSFVFPSPPFLSAPLSPPSDPSAWLSLTFCLLLSHPCLFCLVTLYLFMTFRFPIDVCGIMNIYFDLSSSRVQESAFLQETRDEYHLMFCT